MLLCFAAPPAGVVVEIIQEEPRTGVNQKEGKQVPVLKHIVLKVLINKVLYFVPFNRLFSPTMTMAF